MITINSIFKSFKQSIAWCGLVGMLALTSCADDFAELNKGSDTLTLKANSTDIVLDETNYAENGIILDWTTGNNGGTGNRIYYTLQVAESGTDFAEPVTILYEQTQTYEFSQTVEDLNKFIRNMGVPAGETISLDARVIASGDGFDQQVATTTINITPYEPVTTQLYIIGSAAPNGWSLDNAEEMTRSTNGVFTWEGNLSAGSLKFMCSRDDWVPSYNRGATDEDMVYRATYDDPDEQWQINEAHFYKVAVNLLTKKVTFTQAEGVKPAHDELYLIGNETGWSFWKMATDPIDPFLFRIGVDFEKGGEFKFGTANGSWENNYKATYDNAPYTETSMEFVSGYDPDHKWNLKSDELGAYKICVDIRTGKERMLMAPFTPYDCIYLVGDATPNGWSIDDATPMDKTGDYTFSWTGTLNAGELKFTCDKQSDWNGAWFMAATAGAAPMGSIEQMLFIDKSSEACKAQYLDVSVGDIDQKWKIQESGTYTITLDQLAETISIVKN